MPATKKVTLEQVYAKQLQHDRQFGETAKLIFKMEDSLKEEIARIVQRLQKLEGAVEKQTGDVEKLQEEYYAVLQALKRIEKNMERKPEKKKETNKELKEVFVRLGRVETRLTLVEAERQAR